MLQWANLSPINSKINKDIKINILIVNDGSTDETQKKLNFLKKVSKNKIIYLKHKINFGLNRVS